MELVKDLGMRVQKSGGVSRWGLYRCPKCNNTFERATATIQYDQRKGGSGICRNCSNTIKARESVATRTKTLEQFIIDAVSVHGTTYTYSNSVYITNKVKLTITCSKHGDFLQAPSHHLAGGGCPECALENNNIAQRMSESNTKPTNLYYLYFPEVTLWKLGCTSRTIEERFKQEKLAYEVLYIKEYTSGSEAYTIEKYLLDITKAFQFKGKVLGVKGNSELRTQPVENLEYFIRKAERLYNTLEEDYINH